MNKVVEKKVFSKYKFLLMFPYGTDTTQYLIPFLKTMLYIFSIRQNYATFVITTYCE